MPNGKKNKFFYSYSLIAIKYTTVWLTMCLIDIWLCKKNFKTMPY